MTQQGSTKTNQQSPSGLSGMIERKIAQAYANGLFDNLEDAGKPLDLSQNPFQDPAWRLAFHVLENAGLAPAWVEERRSILQAISRLYPAEKDGRQSQPPAEAGSTESLRQIKTLNKRIANLNLLVPHPAFRLRLIDSSESGRD